MRAGAPMAEHAHSNLVIDERAYLATRVLLTSFAWALVIAGIVTSTSQLESPLIVAGTVLATLTTAGAGIALVRWRARFDRVLEWAVPADLVTLAVLIPALHAYGDPVLAVVIAFVAFYGHALPRRPAVVATVLAAAIYLAAHAIAHESILWHDAVFLGMQTFVIGFVGTMSAVLSERYRERQRAYGEPVHERESLAAELSQRVDELQAISDLNAMIHSSLEVETVAPGIARILSSALGVDRATLIVMDKRDGTTLFRANHGITEPVDDTWRDESAFGSLSPEQRIQRAGHHLSCRSALEHQRYLVLFCTDPDALERLGERDMTVLRAVCSALVVAVENSQLFKLTRQLAVTDELTGLYNYRFLQQRLDEEVERSRRYRSDFSLLMIDADGFKGFNDAYGHVAGDGALADIGRTIRSTVREVDVVARYGGEEFSVVLPETDGAGAFVVAEKIREAIAAFEFADSEGIPGPRLTVSVGLAAFPAHADDKESLLRHADEALYQAKRGGKNRVLTAGPLVAGERGGAATETGDHA